MIRAKDKRLKRDKRLKTKIISAKERASISLFLAAVLIAVISINILVVAGAESALAQTKIAYVLEEESDRALASYDRALYDNLSLWAMSKKTIEDIVTPASNSSNYHIKGLSPVSYALKDKLLDREQLKVQIVDYMKLRMPIALLSESIERSKSLKNELSSVEMTEFTNQAEQMSETYDSTDLINQLDSVTTTELQSATEQYMENDNKESKDNEEKKTSLTYLNEDKKNYLKQQDDMSVVFDMFSDKIQKESGYRANLNINQETDVMQLFFDAINKLDNIGDFSSFALYDQLLCKEYALRMFPSSIHQKRLDDSYPYLKTLKNNKLSEREFSFANSLEYICTGTNSGGQQSEVEFFLYSMRVALNLADFMQNKSKQTEFKSYASLIALALSLLSLGSVNIEPDFIYYILVIIDVMEESSKDLTSLLKGQAVLFLKAKEESALNSAMYYHDYLRIILLLLNNDTVLDRISQAISAEYLADYYVSLTCTCQYENPFIPLEKQVFSVSRKYAIYARADKKAD